MTHSMLLRELLPELELFSLLSLVLTLFQQLLKKQKTHKKECLLVF